MAADLLSAARSGGYPVIIDRGADPGTVLAVLATLIRVAGERTDVGITSLLEMCGEALVHGDIQGSLTHREGEIGIETLALARPWSGRDQNDGPITLQQLHDRATAWAMSHDLVDALAVISVGVQLLAFVESIQPGILTPMAEWIERERWLAHVDEQLSDTTELEETP
ncbi:hypothetical protein AU192_24725 [Mycobacterium lehmannii]|uniref:Uncharacterized protein n=1 Tax=Mycobacterium lehmannii TaxID=2048550 RepID=A0A124EP55_9MYCO|nr:hypothetical protein AU192_24725 [Mycobacterium lehmannii]